MPRIADLFRGGKVPWGTIASVVAQNLTDRAGASHEIVEQLKTWGSFLSKNALAKWSVAVLQPVRCGIHEADTQCDSVSVAVCSCGTPCCLAHAYVSYEADAICFACADLVSGRAAAREARQRREAEAEASRRERAKSRAEEVLRRKAIGDAFDVLGLPPNAPFEEVKRHYKKLVVEYSADTPQTERSRARNTRKLQRINDAFAVLRTHFERKAA